MNPLDDLFRDGLGDRKAEVPADLWQKIAARKGEVPAGETLDHLFADKLGRRQPPVSAGMWDRIAAARRRSPWRPYALAGLLLLLLVPLAWFFGAGPQVPGTDPLAGLPHASQAFPLEAIPPATAAPGTPAGAVPASPKAEVSGNNTADRATTPLTQSTPRTAPAFTGALPSHPTPPAGWTEPAVALPLNPLSVVVSPLPPEVLGTVAEPESTLPELDATVTAPTFRRAGGNRLRGEVLLGAAYAHQRFKLREGESRAVRDAREVSEFPELSYQFSARLQYRLGRRLALLTGLTYAEIRNQLEYDLPSNGRMTLVRRNNHLRLLEVPVLAGYDLSRGRLRLSLNAGPVVNLFSAVGGQYLDPGQAQPLDLADSGYYRGNIGLGWTASLTTTYALGTGHRTRLLLEPFFKSYPRSFTRPGAPLAEHYWIAGLQLGLRRSF